MSLAKYSEGLLVPFSAQPAFVEHSAHEGVPMCRRSGLYELFEQSHERRAINWACAYAELLN
jgi:hypothetical protein